MTALQNIFKPTPGMRPQTACEIRPEGVVAARASTEKRGAGDTLMAFEPLPDGALAPGLKVPNLLHREAVIAAISQALSAVDPRSRDLSVVIPDAAARVLLLDFDTLPAKFQDVLPVVRFRLRKMVPFDVEPAGVSYQILAQNETECKVLAAVIPGPILAEYEAAVREAGYEPGAVLSSSLAALEAADATEGVLAANLSARSITTAVTSGQDLLLYRTLDLPQDAATRTADIARSIAVAAAYFEDKLGAPPRRLYYAGIESPADFATSIGNPELPVVAWAERPEEGALTSLPQTSFAGVTGALAGAS